MGQKIIFLRGLPASGKTTEAKKYIRENPRKYKRVNRDDIRNIFREAYSQEEEKFVKKVKDYIIREALNEGYSVILDDTNLKPQDREAAEKYAEEANAQLVEVDFRKLNYPDLLFHNQQRPEQERVPEEVIKDMYKKYIGEI